MWRQPAPYGPVKPARLEAVRQRQLKSAASAMGVGWLLAFQGHLVLQLLGPDGSCGWLLPPPFPLAMMYLCTSRNGPTWPWGLPCPQGDRGRERAGPQTLAKQLSLPHMVSFLGLGCMFPGFAQLMGHLLQEASGVPETDPQRPLPLNS